LFEVSSKTGAGIDEWCEWLTARIKGAIAASA